KHANLIQHAWELSKESYDERISNIQKDIKEIKDTINNTTARSPKTWAQVVTEGGITTAHAELAKRERMEKAKRTRAKTEVILNLRNSGDEIKERIESLPDKALTEIFQEHIIEEAKLENNTPIKIRGIKK